MTLKNLEGKTLEAIEPDGVVIRRLMEAARRSLADANLSSISPEGRFDMAYKAIMQAANAALQANGWRTLTSRPGHHQTMVQSLTLTIGLDASTMVVLDALRKQRNVIDYSGDEVSASMADECLGHADALITRVTQWLKNNQGNNLS